ncbi:metal-dependent transcriptional regulator [bacterium]|nr:metal-dependent transcriptional regulator [bacterium]
MGQVTENYLKLLYTFQLNADGYIKPLHLSRSLHVTPAAVSDMLKKLADDHYISYVPYKGVRLTNLGIEKGKNMVRRHRILEMYLNQVLKMPWDQVHDEAERLEHASSDELINRMEEALGFPRFDPHGDPIPGKDGTVPTPEKSVPLSRCNAGDLCEVIRVSDSDSSFLHYLGNTGIRLNEVIHIVEIRPFDRSFVIEVNGHKETISKFTADHIFVKDSK